LLFIVAFLFPSKKIQPAFLNYFFGKFYFQHNQFGMTSEWFYAINSQFINELYKTCHSNWRKKQFFIFV